MYARRSITKGPTDQIEAARQRIESEALPRVKQFAGYRGGYWLVDRETGEGVTIGFYETKESLDASRAIASQLRDSAVQSLGGQVVAVDEFEVTADTGQKVHRSASHARLTEVSGNPADFDQAVRVIKDSVIPAARSLPGFVGGFWLGDRDTGKGLAVTLFDSAENIAVTRQTASGIRSRAAEDARSTIGSVREYEILVRAETPMGVAAG